MRKHSIILGGLIAAIALATAVGTASARRLALSESHILSHFRELTFEGGGGVGQVICPVSIEGSFHSRTLSKVCGQLIGYITESQVASSLCSGGHASVLPTTLPWHIVYESFGGTLPNITEIELGLEGAAFLVEIPGLAECLYQSTVAEPMRGMVTREAGGKASGLRSNENAGIPLHLRLSGLFNCPNPGHLRGTGIVGDQVTYREITITLVQ